MAEKICQSGAAEGNFKWWTLWKWILRVWSGGRFFGICSFYILLYSSCNNWEIRANVCMKKQRDVRNSKLLKICMFLTSWHVLHIISGNLKSLCQLGGLIVSRLSQVCYKYRVHLKKHIRSIQIGVKHLDIKLNMIEFNVRHLHATRKDNEINVRLSYFAVVEMLREQHFRCCSLYFCLSLAMLS